MRGVPDIGSIERGDYFRESTIIYDKESNPIYTLFTDGKRTYANYIEISDSIKDAIISTEDKTFFENPGIDAKGLVRAVLNYVTGKADRIKGTSTLSQQLISYTILYKERSIKRKVQEAYLSYKLNKNYSKEKILEMYLNTISFWYNANGIEEASKTYFGKSAKDVWPLGASILASLPKGPTYYSPYSNRDRLMGEVYVYPLDDPSAKISLINPEARKKYSRMYISFKSYLSGMTLEANGNDVIICWVNREYIRNTDFTPDKNSCLEKPYDDLLGFFGDIIVRDTLVESGTTTQFALEYSIGRKDFVGLRMFEDGKIDGTTFKKILYDGLEFEFKKYSENIRYPYFVMYIKEYLESKYGKDIDITQWLKVYTTLDPKLQDKAEELVRKQVAINKVQYWATSAALVSMDNMSGALLAMVGGPDYFDLDNGGNNNMIISQRQPGSSFKPFVYALALAKNPIGPASPIADAKTSFGSWNPDNYDRGFKGVMTLEKALTWSRNIPAVKMFFLAGKEEKLTEFAELLWFTTFKKDAWYGAPMAIGTAEVRPIDLMQAYSVFANLGVKKDLYAISKIQDSDGNILEEHIDMPKEPIFSPAASYIVNTILSNIEARPEWFWRSAITVAGWRRVAAKTGTSNKDVSNGGDKKILPRDLWTAGYSPQITTVVWAGNVDGKETKWSCDGLNCAAGIWKPFMEFAHKDLPKLDWKKPEWVYEYTIAKTSGRLASETTPEDQKVSTMMAFKLTEYDTGFKEEQVDTLCNGPVSENTPAGAIGTILIPIASPIIDGYDDAWKAWFFGSVWSGSRSPLPCDRPGWPGNIDISLRIVDLWWDTNSAKKLIEWSWSWDRAIRDISISYDGESRLKQNLGGSGKLEGSGRISLNFTKPENTITFEIIDIYGYTYREIRTFRNDGDTLGEASLDGSLPSGTIEPSPNGILSMTKKLPIINMINPRGSKVTLYSGNPMNLRFSIDVVPWVREVSVFLGWKLIQSASSWDSFVIPIITTDIALWEYPIRISVVDSTLRKIEKTITLTILPS